MINQFIIDLDRTTRLEIYSEFGTVMYVVMVALFLYAVITKGIAFRNATVIFISFAVAFFMRPIIFGWIKQMTNGLIASGNLGEAFLPFLAIFSLLLWICRVDILSGLDVAVPMYIGGRGACIIGCIFPGCCHGQYAEWGIYSHHANYNTVPCPLIDSVLSFGIVTLIIWCSKKSSIRGKTTAYGMIAFGGLRYIIDVLRDNNKMFGLFTIEGISGFVCLCIGLIMLYILERKVSANRKCCTLF